ncbi:unnamed protein product [Urochloa decumbens]|uniref:Uncharacterized protein n=1 Tax=Urochloa decumbens TaxID=240449 RepID=A0ABC9AZL3_9POAL
MDAAIVGQLLSHTLPVLYKGIQERSKKLSELDADVRFINVQLDFIKAAIREDRKRRNDMSDVRKSWIVQLRHLAYLIEDCVDRFLPHGGEKINPGDLASEIQKCKKLAQAIREGLECYTATSAGSEQNSQQVASSPGSAAPTTSYAQGQHETLAELVGMDERVQDLLALVCESESPVEKKLKVISIVGFGGIGKTQLADQVYRHSDVRNQYPLQAFIGAAGKNTEEILQEVLEELLKQDMKGKTKTSIQTQQHQNGVIHAASTSTQRPLLVQNGVVVHAASASTSTQAPKLQNGVVQCASASSVVSIKMTDVRTRLRSYLQSKRYLIVIDDVRTEQLGSDVVSAFPEQEGVDSRIIVTTSIQSVAKSCSSGDGHVYKMRPLNEEESKNLFFNVARTGPQPTEIPKKCDGVPLALVSIARFCRKDLSRCEEAWRKLCKPEEDYRLARMQRVLVDNYGSLCSLDLHGCLLYLGMFPCGHPIRRGSLIRRWLAEGPDVGCSTSVMAAEKNFDALIDRNVVWPINESIKTCQPPGMMLEYITGESESTDFMALCRGDNDTRRTASSAGIRRLALHGTGAPDDGRVLVEEDVSRLRTLAVFRSNQGEADEAPLSFAKCGLLRVLDLEACHGLNKSHLEEICELLKLLRCLSLRASTSITKVPRKIARLQRLETLDLGKETVVKVPAEVLLLPHLKHLLGKIKLRKCDSGKNRNLDRFLSKESKLEMLSGFVAGKDGRGFPRLMRHMSRLRKVKVWWDPDADATRLQDDLQQSINQFLDRASRMPAIAHSLSMEFQEWSPAFLDSLRAPVVCTLSSMKLRGRGGLNQVPAFVTSLTGIKELCLLATTLSWNAIQGGVKNLNILNDLELVAQGIDGTVVIDSGMLNSLKRMRLEVERRLIQITIHDGAMESLVSLHLICKDLNGPSADQIPRLRNLKEVALHPEVADGTKLSWRDAARRHPNRPNCLLITNSRLMEQTTQPASPNQSSSAAATGMLSNVARKSRQIAGAILHLGTRTRGN